MRGRKVAVQTAVLVFATILGWGTAGPAMASTIEYSGRATAVRTAVSAHADTGELAATGGNLDAAELSAGVPGAVAVDTLHASTIGQAEYVHSEASVGSLAMTEGLNSIAADLIMSRAEAQNQGGWVIRSARSHVDGLLVNGLPVVVTGEPNQTVPLVGGQLVINEQSQTSTGGIESITVIALHLTAGEADIAIGTSRAGLKPPTVAQACSATADFATGGGWLVPTGQALKASFGFVGGVRDGAFHGHLVFKDSQTQDRVKGEVTFYVPGTGNERTMGGQGQINGQFGTFTLNVVDVAEPGAADGFNLEYASEAHGGTATGTLGGGNIQLHPGC